MAPGYEVETPGSKRLLVVPDGTGLLTQRGRRRGSWVVERVTAELQAVVRKNRGRLALLPDRSAG